MRKENKEYLYNLLQERLSLLDERTEQEWEDAADPKGQEMIILAETIGYLNDLLGLNPAELKISRISKTWIFFT